MNVRKRVGSLFTLGLLNHFTHVNIKELCLTEWTLHLKKSYPSHSKMRKNCEVGIIIVINYLLRLGVSSIQHSNREKLFAHIFFLYIHLNPFNTSVLVCPSQVKTSKKSFFLIFLWKVSHNLISKCRIEKVNSFSHIFSSPSSFLPRLVKNVLKLGQNFLFTDLHQNYLIT